MKLKKTPEIKTMESIVKTDKFVLGTFIGGAILVGVHLYDKLRNDQLMLGGCIRMAIDEQKSEREKKEA